MSNMQSYSGGCHCGAVRFSADADLSGAITCNCSICRKAGLVLTFTPAAHFKLEQGAGNLTDYMFGKKTIHHVFCATCGVRPFGRGTGPDGREMIAINVRCLDGVDVGELSPRPFDGASL